MKRKEYIELLSMMDDTKFKEEISAIAIKLDQGVAIQEWKILELKSESERRSYDFDYLLAAGSIPPQSFSFRNYSFRSLDQLDEHEISELKDQIRKRQRNKVDTDKLDTSSLPLFFGIDAKSMIIAPITGDSMTGFGLREGDMVVIDSSVTPKAGEIILIRGVL
jgi:hypothetical protein